MVVQFRKVGKFPKSLPAWEEGIWLGRETESNQHFVATSHGVHKTRSLRRRPLSEQVQKDLVSALRAKPWVFKGSREETDHFVFPPLGPRAASQGVQPLEADGSQRPTVKEEPAEEVEHFHDMPPLFESRASADVLVPEDADLDDMIDRLPDELFKRPLRRSRRHFTRVWSRLQLWSASVRLLRCPKLHQSFSSVLRTIPCVCVTCVCQPSRQSRGLRFLLQ